MLKHLLETKNALEQRRADVMAIIEPKLKDIENKLETINQQIIDTITPVANANRTALKKDTGTIDFTIDGVKVKHDVPKRVEWDQAQLAGIRERIIAGNADPDEYMATVYKVKETNYRAWPSFIKDIFTPARTVKHGQPKITFEIVEPQPAINSQDSPAAPWQPRAIDGGKR